MNDEQLDKLFHDARTDRPDTSRTEYGFETRLVARLRTNREQPAAWYAFTWKLIPVFGAIVAALGVWTAAGPGSGSNDLQSAITGGHEDATLVSYLTGGSL